MSEEKKNASKKNRKRGKNILHILQHLCFVGAAVAGALFLFGGFVEVNLKSGRELYRLSMKDSYTDFEDSEVFNRILGKSVTDIICYGTIRGQMETDGKFDPEKEVDVTAFAGRYEGMKREYITARYYLNDLIKWAQNGFEYNEVYMPAEEVDKFLSRYRTVTVIDEEAQNYEGGTISYLNSDIESYIQVVDVSGNVLAEGGSIRNDTNADVLSNRYHTVEGKNIEDYVSSWDEYYELCNNVVKAAEDLEINYQEYLKYNEYYGSGESNVVYYIRRTIGKKVQVFSNQETVSDKLSDLEGRLKEECGKYIIYDPHNIVYETNTLIEEETLRHILNGYEYSYPEDTQILIGVKTPYAVKDAFAGAKVQYDNYSPYSWKYLAAAILFVIVYIALLAALTFLEGRAGKTEDGRVAIRLERGDKLPTEVMAAAVVIAAALFFSAVNHIIDYVLYVPGLPENYMLLVIIGIAGLLISLIISFIYYSFVRRIKAGTLWKNSLLKRLYSFMKKEAVYLYNHSAVVLRVWVPYGLFVLLHMALVFIGLCFAEEVFTAALILLIVIDIVFGIILYKSALSRQQILESIKRINAGDTEHKIDETTLYGDNLVLAREVNSIGDGIRNAVATSMKDERLKADLITNVSHDIKTPLTSIINYVDLIKRENVENPKVREYIEVLDTKSQRLKQLTDDLVEASKISSGNIVLQWDKINLVELLNQTIGEFSEKFEQKELIPIFRVGKNSIFIEADSRRIWRVIENLFNNICKYALEGTRIYIDIAEMKEEKKEERVAVSIRNISKSPIMVNSDELTERFIRGDESRTTEGSGLGLSIARNLTEVMNGKFEIIVDGDLFKVVLTFPLLKQ